jgi:hypothetical protein
MVRLTNLDISDVRECCNKLNILGTIQSERDNARHFLDDATCLDQY